MAHSDHNAIFRQWMNELNRVAKAEFGFPVNSACECATRPGSVEESEWWGFYLDGMTPREALKVVCADIYRATLRVIDDLNNC